MNNVFKKRFRRKLGLSELLVECDKVSVSLRENELDEDFQSRRKSPVTSIPLLKTTANSYTRRMFKEFEEEFKQQFSFSCKLLPSEGSVLTYMVTHMYSDYGATVVFNKKDLPIACACRKYESIGMYTLFKFHKYILIQIADFITPTSYRYIVQAYPQSVQCERCFHVTVTIYNEQVDKICKERILY
jgi:hypothetical protein